MRPLGFSTGALARGDFRRGLSLLRSFHADAVELSALRIEELQPLVEGIPDLDLRPYSFVSIHAPSRFSSGQEKWVTEQLHLFAKRGYPIVIHPDVIFTPALWKPFGGMLLIENMDKRKPVGRNVTELNQIFEALSCARWCFDIGHARQVDPSMTEASLMLEAFGNRLAEVHISEVNTASRHDPISWNAVLAFQSVARYIPQDTPVILETLIDRNQSEIEIEMQRARSALSLGPESVSNYSPSTS